MAHLVSRRPQFFNFDAATVRVIGPASAPLFVAKDVCAALEIERTDSALRSLEEDEKGTHTVSTLGGPQEMAVVNESGLYALIFKSRKPSARTFRKWVTSDVLPAIRRNERFTRLAEGNYVLEINSLQEEVQRLKYPIGRAGKRASVPRERIIGELKSLYRGTLFGRVSVRVRGDELVEEAKSNGLFPWLQGDAMERQSALRRILLRYEDCAFAIYPWYYAVCSRAAPEPGEPQRWCIDRLEVSGGAK